MKRLCGVLLVLLMICAAGFAAQSEAAQYYHNEAHGISFPIPDGWVQVPADAAEDVDLQLYSADGAAMIRVLHEDWTIISPSFSPLEAYSLAINNTTKAEFARGMGLPESAVVIASLNGISYFQVENTIQSVNTCACVTFQHGIFYQYLFYTMAPWDDAAFDAYYTDFMTILNGVQYTDPNPALGRIYRTQLFFSYALAACAVLLLHGLLPRQVALTIYRKTGKRRELDIVVGNWVLWGIVLAILLMTQLPDGVIWFALALSLAASVGIYYHIDRVLNKAGN
ncbi:MAG: hypothetical protein LBN04_00530 [Oscillospiraceae bacterium]|jgi:hypothetical protein|nr:hypothetical protein [Oscillospiraceae bacterium]